jgi:hypothetical protein
MYNLCSPGTYSLIHSNFLYPRAPILKKTNSGMLFIWSSCPPLYVTDIGTIFFVHFPTTVCKTYVKKNNSQMLNFWDMSPLKLK